MGNSLQACLVRTGQHGYLIDNITNMNLLIDIVNFIDDVASNQPSPSAAGARCRISACITSQAREPCECRLRIKATCKGGKGGKPCSIPNT
jgi:hypothetical protein